MSSSPKILLLYAHPEAQESVVNSKLLKAARRVEHVTVHDLYATYPNFFIDIYREQQLLREHDIIVFQYPLYTYSCPSLLKEWLDRVLSRGFASGMGESALEGKTLRCVVTTGEPESAYQSQGLNRYPLGEIMRPFELVAQTCHMQWMSPMVIYHARRQPLDVLKSLAAAYSDWLTQPLPEEIMDGRI
ncbi:glutathione-regulated potassium-efflux system ancillary protein KefG [Rosenbergiella epipactidis]|uniref:Glutathione-regulated potassium-efflux system ancillary protein KefG n=1 Tax=Rosenbergiella nectarea TaxID=988801 RepID=A0A1H9KSW9_9GAMM|nr:MULTISPECIES: glutathione-regulated potassium-efflux system ancillary protein KefG [Erwiniaceae]KMV71068.1 potassium transporter KefG [bacteria symbiont BFo2 of Frankliniella occidentalis]KYP94326.1 potassium transporter KefG [bacteria symbiont BFo2 of Frankliniella occidentalis]MBT0719301.1 glutathione-regulated potassium-efflux system ancillary protein KefG [Rosenbergiella epipactidis]PIJ43853.1 glutathione-regulated potassium-efflux system ancillary protein KefG [Tatumella sp. OPLPL6]SER